MIVTLGMALLRLVETNVGCSKLDLGFGNRSCCMDDSNAGIVLAKEKAYGYGIILGRQITICAELSKPTCRLLVLVEWTGTTDLSYLSHSISRPLTIRSTSLRGSSAAFFSKLSRDCQSLLCRSRNEPVLEGGKGGRLSVSCNFGGNIVTSTFDPSIVAAEGGSM